jgi:CO/xanthine dehydrogenase Mo-binding subunit
MIGFADAGLRIQDQGVHMTTTAPQQSNCESLLCESNRLSCVSFCDCSPFLYPSEQRQAVGVEHLARVTPTPPVPVDAGDTQSGAGPIPASARTFAWTTLAFPVVLDELAAAAGADPVAFRMQYLDANDKRGIEVLERAAKLAKWEKRPSPKGGQSGDVATGRGVTYCKYELVRTYIAAVAEVEVKRSNGAIRCTRFYIARDCGQIINPDGLKNQIEGNVIQTMSRTLKEELKFSRSAVTSLDWASYPNPTFPEIPEIIMGLIDRPSLPPWGPGEPSAAVVPSAISNAAFDAIGVRLRSVPFTPEKVKAAPRAA